MNTQHTFADVLIKPKYSEILSRKNVDISTLLNNNYFPLPIIAANMKTICSTKMAVEMAINGGLGILHRFNTIEQAVRDYLDAIFQISSRISVDGEMLQKYCGVSIGVQSDDVIRFHKLYEAGARIFAIDVAHGHHVLVKNMIKTMKSSLPNDITIIAGNIATSEAALDLTEWGANCLKCGIGGGSVCSTRSKTGIGVPQLYALEEIAKTIDANKLDVSLIADGGIVNIGDIPKALKYADSVMIGSMIAGTSETPGTVLRDPNGQFYKLYGGSASGENKGHNQFVEGVMKTIPFRGKVKYILREIHDGIASSFSYVGANTLQEFQQKCEFIYLTPNSTKESKI